MSEQLYQVKKVTAVPSTPTSPNTVFYLAPTDHSDYVEIYVSDKNGTAVRRVLNEADVIALVQRHAGQTQTAKYIIVDDIDTRNGLSDKSTAVYVKDATGDSTVKRGGAFYLYDSQAEKWIKTSESESMDVVLQWDNVQGKPTATADAIDLAVQNSHGHANKTQLDLIGQDNQGNLTYNSKIVATTINDAW